MKRNHLSLEERSIIERLVQEGKSNKAIAEVLDRSKSTIGRELERNCWNLKHREYQSKEADGVAKKRRRHERKSRISEKIWQKIFEFYNEDWSPEQISGVLKLRGVCVSHETIYRRLYAEIRAGRLEREHLRWERKKRRRRLPKRPLGIPRNFQSKAVPISVPERNLVIGKATRLSWFVGKAIS